MMDLIDRIGGTHVDLVTRRKQRTSTFLVVVMGFLLSSLKWGF